MNQISDRAKQLAEEMEKCWWRDNYGCEFDDVKAVELIQAALDAERAELVAEVDRLRAERDCLLNHGIREDRRVVVSGNTTTDRVTDALGGKKNGVSYGD